jgi:symplekin
VEFQCQATGNEGVRLLAVKFVEKTVLMYTPDPNVPSDPPTETTEGAAYVSFHMELNIFSMFRNCWVHADLGIRRTFAVMGFNVAWLRAGGHPLLNVGDLAMEASQSLGLLLEQLKYPKVKSLSTSMIIVFITRFASCSLVFYYNISVYYSLYQLPSN